MSDPRLDEKRVSAKALLAEVNAEVMKAIALAEIYSRGNSKATVAAVNAIGGGGAFGLIRDSVHQDLCLVLLRLFDRDKDSLSFKRALRALDGGVAINKPAFDSAAKAYEETNRAEFREELTNLRNRVIAHTDLSGKGHDARYGDEMKLLQQVLVISDALNDASSLAFLTKYVAAEWKVHAEAFWAVFGGASPAKPKVGI